VTDQLSLFGDGPDERIELAKPERPLDGEDRLLRELARRGLDGDALERAAALAVELGGEDAPCSNGARRPKPCRCEPGGLDVWDAAGFEARCLRCGRVPAP
jgi:hypothetical protein